MLIQALNRPTRSASPYQQPLALMAASDASADPDSKTAALGGWFHFGSSPKTRPGKVVLQVYQHTRSSVGLQGRQSTKTNCSPGTLWFSSAAALSPSALRGLSIPANSNIDRQPIQCSHYASKQIQEMAKCSNPYGTLAATTCQPILLGPGFHSPGAKRLVRSALQR